VASYRSGLAARFDAAFSIFPAAGKSRVPRARWGLDAAGREVFGQPVERHPVSAPRRPTRWSAARDVVDRGPVLRCANGRPRTDWSRPERPTTTATRGSSASRRRWSRVWVGFDSARFNRESAYGARVALPIWADFMRDVSTIRLPAAFESRRVPRRSSCVGLLPQARVKLPCLPEYFSRGDVVPSILVRFTPDRRGSGRARVEGFFGRSASSFDEIVEPGVG